MLESEENLIKLYFYGNRNPRIHKFTFTYEKILNLNCGTNEICFLILSSSNMIDRWLKSIVHH